MLFLALLHDKPGHLNVRMDTRPVHLEWMASTAGKVRLAGPYLDDTGAEPRGSLLVVEADDIAAARALLAQDPYAKAGLFASSEIHPWRWVVGNPDA